MLNDKQLEIINELGFVETSLGTLISQLKAKPTQAAANVVQRIQRQTNGDYIIFKDETRFTIESKFLITKEEQKQIGSVLGLEYIRLSELLTKKGLWQDWVRSIKY